MGTASHAMPLPVLECYPERRSSRLETLDRLAGALAAPIVARAGSVWRRRLSRIVPAVEAYDAALRRLDDDALRGVARELRPLLRSSRGQDPAAVARSFAVVREAAARTLSMRHVPAQLLGGYALLRGMVAEMETGEGKTLTATLAAATAAFAGEGVHVVTVNDYLARRDAVTMGPLYRFLGFSVGAVVGGQSDDERRAQYRCHIVYCTNKEVAFDYMRDALKWGHRRGNLQRLAGRLFDGASPPIDPVMRGLPFAIVDEADSVLVDEARTPLIISGEVDAPVSKEMLEQALEVAGTLDAGADFRILSAERLVLLTDSCDERLSSLAETLGGPWRIRALREELIGQALSAIHLFHRDRDYLVREGEIVIVDEYTGRVMDDRQWSRGLHQLVELKEGCETTGQRATIARMTYQRFFRRYRRLAGMTGTAREVADELWRVYRLPFVDIPTHRPTRRLELPTVMTDTQDEKWERIAARIEELSRAGRPVLLGTRSVAASRAASAALSRRGLPHALLNAAQDAEEAEIVARAGDPGRITIATNMAGRGTDIRLPEGVAEVGGLHVILSERHDAGRIDRQLGGRCARQGDPGSFEAILSLEDPLLDLWRPWQRELLRRHPRLGRRAHRNAQRIAERRHSHLRRELLRQSDLLSDQLAFSGEAE